MSESGDGAELAPLRTALEEGIAHLDAPMRVAIVGHIKAGKSTLLNAFLGEELAPTGIEELTFNVNWLRYGPTPRVFIHRREGGPPEERPVSELEALTSRQEIPDELIRSIRYVERRSPNDMLRSFDLIDTPGLKSHFSTDTKNALEHLGLTVDDIEGVTRQESGQADALLCLFSRSLARAEQSVVKEFQGPLLSLATPITAIGVLTKSDTYWDHRNPDRDPLDAGREVAGQIEDEPEADRVFFAVVPVCGLLAFGARTITAGELDALRNLAEVDGELLARRLGYATQFATKEYEELRTAPGERAALLARLGQYGIWLGARLLRDGTADEGSLREQLWQRSGVAGLRGLVISHFGHRALLIKTHTKLSAALHQCFLARHGPDDEARTAAAAASGALEALELSEAGFEEFALLRRYYKERDTLGLGEEEGRELLRVTGEDGTSIAHRLGLDERALPRELIAAADERLAYWEAARDAFGADTRTVATARVMVGVYQRIRFHAREASRHLELDP